MSKSRAATGVVTASEMIAGHNPAALAGRVDSVLAKGLTRSEGILSIRRSRDLINKYLEEMPLTSRDSGKTTRLHFKAWAGSLAHR